MTLTHYIGGKLTGLTADFPPSLNYPENTTFINTETFQEFILVAGVWEEVGAVGFIVATGGVETTDGDFKVHTFSTIGSAENFEITSGQGNLQLLVIAAGGGASGAGAGAGGYLEVSDLFRTVGTFTVTVGDGGLGALSNGGTNGNKGEDSVFDNQTAEGGGFGGGLDTGGLGDSGGNGGSGGGTYKAGGASGVPGTGVVGQGFAGSIGINLDPDIPHGAGGGASEAGFNAPNQTTCGAGGDGKSSDIQQTGVFVFRAGGGGAGAIRSGAAGGAGGNGGGGQGTDTGGNGTVNTGSGGGGINSTGTGGDGGSGIVIVRYQFQ